MSVILTTYNRCEDLRVTLEAMSKVDRTGLEVQFVVVDNNSSDHTKEIVEGFVPTFPVSYLFEERQGKNFAVNKALNNVDIGDVVIFTDDDITPEINWLQAIRRSLEEFPQISVFGGSIKVDWGGRRAPDWSFVPQVMSTVFGEHEMGGKPVLYIDGQAPFGGNFWIRSESLSGKLSFDERIGPRPKNRIMGSETSFLMSLANRGFRMLYCPDAVVYHRVQEDLFSLDMVYRRKFRQGRARVFIRGVRDPEVLVASRGRWYLLQAIHMVKPVMVLLRSFFTVASVKRIERRMYFWAHWGITYQSILIVRESDG